jgi:hypothetical protein
MDAKLKKMIDDFFKKHEGNAICLEMFGNIDYGDRARECYWEERIEEFSHAMSLEQTYGEKELPKKLIFANLGVDDEDITSENVSEVGDIAGAVFNILPWDVHDFDGDVNQYWYGLVIVTSDYKVLRVTSAGDDCIYRSTIGDLTKFGSEEQELEKRNIKSIKSSIGNIKSKFKELTSDEGKAKVKELIKKLSEAIK